MNESNEYVGVFTDCSDYKQKLDEIIDELFVEVKYRPIEVIIEKVRQVTDEYVITVGERPDTRALDRMATLILNGEITDPHPDKMTRNEYPIMSDTQREERVKDEVPLIWAQEVGTDGIDYRPRNRDTNRKMRDVLGGHLPDKSVIKANRERRDRRRDFTKTQPVHVYRIDEDITSEQDS